MRCDLVSYSGLSSNEGFTAQQKCSLYILGCDCFKKLLSPENSTLEFTYFLEHWDRSNCFTDEKVKNPVDTVVIVQIPDRIYVQTNKYNLKVGIWKEK